MASRLSLHYEYRRTLLWYLIEKSTKWILEQSRTCQRIEKIKLKEALSLSFFFKDETIFFLSRIFQDYWRLIHVYHSQSVRTSKQPNFSVICACLVSKFRKNKSQGCLSVKEGLKARRKGLIWTKMENLKIGTVPMSTWFRAITDGNPGVPIAKLPQRIGGEMDEGRWKTQKIKGPPQQLPSIHAKLEFYERVWFYGKSP